jgi:hypothetical protein
MGQKKSGTHRFCAECRLYKKLSGFNYFTTTFLPLMM